MSFFDRWFGSDVTASPAAEPPPPAASYDYVTPLEALLKLREGCRYTVYRDSLGKLTGGIGHLILPDDDMQYGEGITPEFVDAWFLKDSRGALDAALRQAKEAGITYGPFVVALASVCFQMGNAWTKVFPSTWGMICAGDYERAAVAVGVSRWARQTPVRVADFQAALRAIPPKVKQ